MLDPIRPAWLWIAAAGFLVVDCRQAKSMLKYDELTNVFGWRLVDDVAGK
jgi:hypothetical protein